MGPSRRPLFPKLLILLAAGPLCLNAQTPVTLSASSSPSIFGAPVVLTAGVTPQTATGKVTFYDGLTVLGSKPLVFGGASLTVSLLPAGVRHLRAYYQGDSSHAAASSPVVTLSVNAQPSSNLARSPSPFATNRLLAVGDFNGDGKADIATASFTSNQTVVILVGDGAGNLSPGFTWTSADFIDYLTLGDFNGDGIPDLAITTERSPAAHLSILLGNGDGTFQAPLTYPIPGTVFSQAAGDFNGDGKLDLALASPNAGLTILLGQGDGTFQTGNTYLTSVQNGQGQQTIVATVADFNGDGRADLAIVDANGLGILLGSGDGTFQPAVRNPGLAFGFPFAVGDFNGDGKADLATGAGNVLLGNGDGTFRPGSAQANVPGLLGLLVGEFNGDGKTDFAVLSGNTVEIVFGTTVSVTATGGTPQSTPVNTAFPAPLQVTVKNGATPLAGVAVQFFTLPFQANATLSSATATTDANGVASVTATANSVTGRVNVTAASGLSAQFALINLSGPASVMTPAPVTQSAQVGTAFTRLLEVTLMDSLGQPASGVTVTFTAPTSGPSAVLSSATAVTDANGTASVMATANSIAGSYSVIATAPGLSATFAMTNRSPINTTATVTLTASSNPSTLGGPLILTATISSPGANGRVTFFDGVTPLGSKTVSAGTASLSTVLLASGVHKLTAYYRDETNLVAGSSSAVTVTVKAVAGGAFTGSSSGSLNSVPIRPAAVVVGDFNRDGKVDLAYLPSFGGNITVATGNGNGSFSTPYPSVYPTGLQGASSLVAADFDGDGITDLVAAAPTGALGVLLGASLGVPTAVPSHYPATSTATPTPANSTSALAVGDFNGDGKADLVYAYVANGPPTQGAPTYFIAVNLVPGAGDGTFGFPVAYASLPASPVFPIVADLKVADFNGDGKPDLAILQSNGGVTIVLGNGDATAQAPAFLAPSGLSLLYSLVVGDFNGDGKPDLAIGGVESTTATTVILLGRGDGTFQAGTTYSGADALAGDFNGDGLTDLVVTDSLGNMQGILSGRGDGSFQQGLVFPAGMPLVVSDFNGDGKADIFASTGTLLGAAPLTNGAGPPASIQVTGTSQFAPAGGSAFPKPLTVTVYDANGTPVGGASVTFTAPTVGPSATLSSTAVLTNIAGVAQVTASTNNIVGGYTVTAQVGGLSASFSLVNVLGANLAQNRFATQSSTLPGAPGAGVAVDGNPDGNFYDRSVTATNLEPNPWWQVDLGASAFVNTVYIFNRTDCCQARLSDYWIFVSDTPFLPTDTPATLQNRAGTYANHQTTAPSPSNAIFTAATGRYVRVQLSGTDYLSLAEVEVAGTGGAPPVSNLAFGKPAIQSSTFPAYTSRSGYSPAAAGSAVDGNTDGAFFDSSVTATNLDPNAWWQVDLGSSASISSVAIWNRTDCCGARLSDYWVFISDTPFAFTDTPATLMNRAGTFASHQTVAPNPSVSIPVGVQGRYVRVQLSDTDYLSLAEVQVFGTPGVVPVNLALNRTAAESSTFPGSPSANAAVDGNTDGNYYDGSVTATNLDPNPWWQVDVGSSRSVSSIVIWNRTDCCGARLGDYWVFVSNTPFLATDTPATLQGRAGIFASHQTAAPNPSTTINVGASGEYVRVQLTSAGYLSLAEVQVFGQ